MTHQNLFQPRPIHFPSLLKAMLIGFAIGLLAISFFVFGVDEPNPNWPEFWRVRPLIVTPLTAAFGGAGFYIATNQLSNNSIQKTAGYVVGIIGFVVALWLGIVLGLDGTMWN